MADINHINLTALKSLKTEFDAEKSNFVNNTYSKFSSSYFCSTSNPVVSRMQNSLNKIYKNIDNGYKNIDKWWSDYNTSVEELENLLAKKSAAQTRLDASVVSYVRGQLFGLDEEAANNLGLNLFSSNQDTGKEFNAAFSMSTDFSSLYRDYVEEEVVVVEDKTWLEKKMSWVETEARALSENIEQAYRSTGATVLNAVTGLTEGVGEFGEAVYDAGVTAKTALMSIPTAGYDLVKLGSNKVFGTNFESTTVKMWEGTQAHVAKKHVDTFFSETVRGDNFFGNYLRESYFYEETRSISEGIGYMAAAIAVSAATGIPPAAISGVAGFGKGNEKAWADGASIQEGLLSGVLTGAKDAAQYYVGGKMAKATMPFATRFTSTAVQKTLNAGYRVSVDAATGALEEAAVPFIDTIYKKGYYNAGGEFVEFTNQGFMERYQELFEDNGGWASVRNGAVMGAAMSGLMETIPAAFSKIKTNTNTVGSKKTTSFSDNLNKNSFENVVESSVIKKIADAEFDNSKTIFAKDKFASLSAQAVREIEGVRIYEYKYATESKIFNFFSNQNLMKTLATADDASRKKIFDDFLSPERLASKKNGFVGEVYVDNNGGFSKVLNTEIDALINKTGLKSIADKEAFDRINAEVKESIKNSVIEPRGRTQFTNDYKVEEISVGNAGRAIKLANSGLIVNGTDVLYKFDYTDWLGNKMSIFSDTNLTQTLKNVDEATAINLVDDFLSPKRVFSKKNNYIGGVEVANGSINKFLFEGSDKFFEAASSFKTYDSGSKFNSKNGITFKISEVGNYSKNGEVYNSYLVKTSDFPEGRILHTKENLINGLNTSYASEFKRYLEDRFLISGVFEKLDDVIHVNFDFKAGKELIDLVNYKNIIEKKPDINIKNITSNTVEYADGLSNRTKFELINQVEMDGKNYFLYNLSAVYGANQKCYTDVDIISLLKSFDSSPNSRAMAQEFLNANRLRSVTSGNSISYLGSIVNDGNGMRKIVTDLEITKKLNQKFTNVRDERLNSTTGTGNSYGVDQNIINRIRENRDFKVKSKYKIFDSFSKKTESKLVITEKGENLINKLKSEYNMSDFDARVTLRYLDSAGACSYAGFANTILANFADKPQQFKEIFGFEMLENVNGRTQLNTSELLLDMYMFVNRVENGGNIFEKASDGTLKIANKQNIDISKATHDNLKQYFNADNQQYFILSNGINEKLVNNYLLSKNSSVSFNTTQLINNHSGNQISTDTIAEITEKVRKNLLEDAEVTLVMYNTNAEIRFLNPDKKIYSTTEVWGEGQDGSGIKKAAGHAVFVTGIDETGFIISSWGKKLLIPFEDLLHGSSFSINLSKITVGGN